MMLSWVVCGDFELRVMKSEELEKYLLSKVGRGCLNVKIGYGSQVAG